MTEITTYKTQASQCATDDNWNAYVSEISTIKNFVEANAKNPGRYWGGFMLDEGRNL